MEDTLNQPGLKAAEILKSTPSWLVTIKPAGVSSEREGMGQLLSRALSRPVDTIYPVHRLDREVSGVMVYALNPETAAKLSAASAAHQLRKTYLALVHGLPETGEGCWEDLLYHDQRRNKTYVVQRMRRGVKPARLNFRVLKTIPAAQAGNPEEKPLSLMEITLETGRTHQIRVQCASRSLPILGDRRYGGGKWSEMGLWSWKLSFSDPDTGETESFTAPWPRGLSSLIPEEAGFRNNPGEK